MSKPRLSPLEIVNASGFPLQLGIAREVNRTTGEHGWSVEAEEHHCLNRVAKTSGYADLVLKHSSYIVRLVVECKRAKDSNWIFLVPSDRADSTDRFTMYHATIDDRFADGQFLGGWFDIPFRPVCPEAKFCAMEERGNLRLMLEHIADELLPSVEAIAVEEVTIERRGRRSGPRLAYMPIIVTTANLYACKFDPGDVSLSDGSVPADRCELSPTPYFKFRKGLAEGGRMDSDATSLKGANAGEERTLLVVQATELVAFLKEFQTNTTTSPSMYQAHGFLLQSNEQHPDS